MKNVLIITFLLAVVACSSFAGKTSKNKNPKLKHITTITRE